jgi:hypothetical protein
MAVRDFNGTSDWCKLSIGGLSAATFGTFGALFQPADLAAFRALMVFLDSGNNFLWMPFGISGSDEMTYHGTSDVVTASAIPQDVWLTMLVRKATGTATPRFSYYNHDTAVWTHGNASGTTGNGTAPTSGFINTATTGGADEVFAGRLAVTAGWANAVHWSADGSGDALIEAAGLEDSLQNWVDEAPDMLVPWNPAVAAGIVDIVGTSNQIAIAGTTQVTGDDPPGFDFTLGGPPEGPFAMSRPPVIIP